MFWVTLRQLRIGTAGTRKKAAQELYRDPNPRALRALAAATLTDPDAEVRRLAAAALGRLGAPGRYEPLFQALQDREPEVIKSAMSGLRRATDERVTRELVPLLRHQNFSVRTSAAQTIDTIRWVPRDGEERLWFQIAKGWYGRAAASGAEALPALQLTIQTGPVSAAVRTVEALGLISDPRVVKLLRSSLQSNELAVRIAAADSLGKVGGVEAVEALSACLRSDHTQVRVAAVQALGKLKAAEATGVIGKMLQDKEWEVRQEAAVALGRLGNSEACEALVTALNDSDADVREAGVMALG